MLTDLSTSSVVLLIYYLHKDAVSILGIKKITSHLYLLLNSFKHSRFYAVGTSVARSRILRVQRTLTSTAYDISTSYTLPFAKDLIDSKPSEFSKR